MAKTLGAKARWGGRGRKFKSCHSDQKKQDKPRVCPAFSYFIHITNLLFLTFDHMFDHNAENYGFRNSLLNDPKAFFFVYRILSFNP